MPPKKRAQKPKNDKNKRRKKKMSASSDDDFDSDSGAKTGSNDVFNDNNHNNHDQHLDDDNNDMTADESLMPPMPQISGRLLVSGGTNWDLIGRKELPKAAKNSAQTSTGISLVLLSFNCFNNFQSLY